MLDKYNILQFAYVCIRVCAKIFIETIISINVPPFVIPRQFDSYEIEFCKTKFFSYVFRVSSDSFRGYVLSIRRREEKNVPFLLSFLTTDFKVTIL